MGFIKQTFDKWSGNDQRKKAKKRRGWAQERYNHASNLKNEYQSSVEPQIRYIEQAICSRG